MWQTLCADLSTRDRILDEATYVKIAKETATDEVIRKISVLKGPNGARKGAMLWIASARANRDVKLQRRSIRVAHQMQISLERAFPELDAKFIGDVVADLNSLWDLGQKLDKMLKMLFGMRFPRDHNQLRRFLIDVEVRQLGEASYLISRLNRRVPALLRSLDRQDKKRQGLSRESRKRLVR